MEFWFGVDVQQPLALVSPEETYSDSLDWTVFVLSSCMRKAKSRNSILLLESHRIQLGGNLIKKAAPSHSHMKLCWHLVTCRFCKTRIINPNPISQSQFLFEWQMLKGHFQLAFQLFYSLYFLLLLILLCRCCCLLSFQHEIDTPGSAFCANSPPAATADFTNDGETARRAKG